MKTLWIALTAGALCAAPPLTRQEVEVLHQKLSNWGRWGAEDQRGALNLITAQKRKQAAALIKEGFSVSLAHDAIKQPADDSPAFEHKMLATGAGKSSGAMDSYSVRYHGFTVTHLDALCHVFHEGKMYNGIPQSAVTDAGAGKLSVNQMREGIVTRGVLVDLPRLLGKKYLAGKQGIQPEDLDRWEKESKIRIQPGDAVLFRTGRWARRAAEGSWKIMQDSAGLDARCLPWLKQRDVAVVGSDLATDVMPSGTPEIVLPLHLVLINGMGVPILDNLDLEAASEAAAKRGRWEFFLTVAPLPVEGGTGSPVNPIAIF